MQDFDKLEGILKEYKNFLKESDSIDMNLPLHAHLAGFDEEGLKIAVHVRTPTLSTHFLILLSVSARSLISCIHRCMPAGLKRPTR